MNKNIVSELVASYNNKVVPGYELSNKYHEHELQRVKKLATEYGGIGFVVWLDKLILLNNSI